jgi:signal transduction histidine kinase
MSGNLLLDWSIMTISLFNTILLIWLGLTVLLNSDRRTWGIWLGSGGLLLGGAFFVSHTAILGSRLLEFRWWGFLFWWTAGLIPAILLPFVWYIVILWYAGYWDNPNSALHRRQKWGLMLVIAGMVTGLIILAMSVVLLAIPIDLLTPLRSFVRWSVAGVPVIVMGYSLYTIFCIALSFDALARPGPSSRVMAAQARQRARPWLTVASVGLLLVSFLIAGVMIWLAQNFRLRSIYATMPALFVELAVFDFVIAGIIGAVVLLAGQAIVRYEVFTGRTLPRSGLARHWYRTILLAGGFSVVMGATLTLDTRPIYITLFSALIITFFFALVGWRSYAERERYVGNLRPFIASQGLYDQLLTESSPPALDLKTPFHALCADVLGVSRGYLIATGSLATLMGKPLRYPEGDGGELVAKMPAFTTLLAQFATPQTPSQAVDPAQFGDAIWAIPLWSERGLNGVFLLGEKRGGSLFTQEEIDIARVSGERLLDTQASAQMGHRLMSLQRERLVQSQIIDQRTRRTLHDDILPIIHTAMISLSGDGDHNEVLTNLADAHRQISDLLRDMPQTAHLEVSKLGLLKVLRRVVDNELAHAFDEVVWDIDEAGEVAGRKMPALSAEVIYYAAREIIRNAAQHGRDPHSTTPFVLTIKATAGQQFQLEIKDNGVGVGKENAGISSSGAGQGLALHTTMMAIVGGDLSIESIPNQHTRVTISLPL